MNATPSALTRTVALRSGAEMPAIGFGTWRMGEDRGEAVGEQAALARALERGFLHFDTAEMYGEGGAETVLGAALRGVERERMFLTSKFYPWHAGAGDMVACCEASLRRLGTDYLDLYLLHWPGSVPMEETLEGAERLRARGLIRAFGVSNFDAGEMQSLAAAGLDNAIEANQVLYNPSRRGIEFDLLPWLEERGIVCIAYTPIEPQRLSANAAFRSVAEDAGLGVAELALAWHMTQARACPIPKAATLAHVDALADAAERRLGEDLLAAIDAACPPPTAASPLEIL
ncbi:MAG: aldo/keto reductase [Pseudomonadota bacterium]